MAYGCPVGTLCGELAKLDHIVRGRAAEIFDLFRHWLSRQFIAVGREADADAFAMHVLMWSQGVAALAAAYRDETFVRREVENISTWLEARLPKPTAFSEIVPVQPS